MGDERADAAKRGRRGRDDPRRQDVQIPETLQVLYNYPDFLLHYSVLHHNSYGPNGPVQHRVIGVLGQNLGSEVEAGSPLIVTRSPYWTEPLRDEAGNSYELWLVADIEIGATSAALCHLANASFRVGRKLSWDHAGREFVNDAAASQLLTRDYRRPYTV